MTLDEYRVRLDALRDAYRSQLLALEATIPAYGLPLFVTPGAGESNLLHYAVRNIARSQRDEALIQRETERLEAEFDAGAAALRRELDS